MNQYFDFAISSIKLIILYSSFNIFQDTKGSNIMYLLVFNLYNYLFGFANALMYMAITLLTNLMINYDKVYPATLSVCDKYGKFSRFYQDEKLRDGNNSILLAETIIGLVEKVIKLCTHLKNFAAYCDKINNTIIYGISKIHTLYLSNTSKYLQNSAYGINNMFVNDVSKIWELYIKYDQNECKRHTESPDDTSESVSDTCSDDSQISTNGTTPLQRPELVGLGKLLGSLKELDDISNEFKRNPKMKQFGNLGIGDFDNIQNMDKLFESFKKLNDFSPEFKQ